MARASRLALTSLLALACLAAGAAAAAVAACADTAPSTALEDRLKKAGVPADKRGCQGLDDYPQSRSAGQQWQRVCDSAAARREKVAELCCQSCEHLRKERDDDDEESDPEGGTGLAVKGLLAAVVVLLIAAMYVAAGGDNGSKVTPIDIPAPVPAPQPQAAAQPGVQQQQFVPGQQYQGVDTTGDGLANYVSAADPARAPGAGPAAPALALPCRCS